MYTRENIYVHSICIYIYSLYMYMVVSAAGIARKKEYPVGCRLALNRELVYVSQEKNLVDALS